MSKFKLWPGRVQTVVGVVFYLYLMFVCIRGPWWSKLVAVIFALYAVNVVASLALHRTAWYTKSTSRGWWYRWAFRRLRFKMKQILPDHALLSYPWAIFVELEIPAIFEQGGLPAVREAIDGWGEKQEKAFDAMIHKVCEKHFATESILDDDFVLTPDEDESP